MSCNHIISDTEIENIYKKSQYYDVQLQRKDCRFNDTSKYVFIEVKKDNEIILDKPIIWDYLKESRLFKNAPHSGYGKVAKYEQIEIKSKFRDEKIAKHFDTKAYEVYKRNNFKEIQMHAIKDGIIVWPKLFYQFVNPNDEKKLLMEFEKYLFDIHSIVDDNTRNKKMEKLKNINDIPKSLSKPKDGKISFADYLANKIQAKKLSILSKLYKEVS